LKDHQETKMTIEQLKKLRLDSLEIISKYNQVENHKELKPIEGYGENWSTFPERDYWYHALWADDIKSTQVVGFNFHNGKLYSFQERETSLKFEDAISDLEKQLSKIPLKNIN
jgi:hypothetical protein